MCNVTFEFACALHSLSGIGQYSDWAAGWTPGESSFFVRHGQEMFLLCEGFRPAMGPTELPIPWLAGIIFGR
jgi:hypothetical protein